MFYAIHVNKRCHLHKMLLSYTILALASRQQILYRVRQIKVIPCRVLLISQQQIAIFIRKFTRLLLVHIYV